VVSMEKDIKKGAFQYLVRSLIAPALMGTIFFLAAGTISFVNGWILYGLYFAIAIISNLILLRKNPELMYYRTKLNKDGIKEWDKILMPLAIITGFHLQSLVMGLDIRFGWTSIDIENLPLGITLYVLSFIIGSWAMLVNKYFEPNVRIQKDRDHQVISDGPYKLVRHPGYVGFIIGSFGSVLIIGSSAGLFIAVISSLLIILRTKFEDDTLQKELPGYKNYSLKVRSRLIPGIW